MRPTPHLNGLLLFLATLVTSPLQAARADGPTPERITVETPDGPRAAWVVADPPRAGPRAVVLLLHGQGGSAEQVLGVSGRSASPLSEWVGIARRENIVVVALQGERGDGGRTRGWNDCRADTRKLPATDDVAYARAVAARMIAERGGDPARLYAMGMSNGAMMTYRLALQMPELAAFAAVSGSMAADSRCPESPSGRISALIIGGEADPIVPWAGGQVHLGNEPGRGRVIAVPEVFERWALAHRLDPGAAKSTVLPSHRVGDETEAQVSFFGASPAQSPVTLVRVKGGGHVEPSLRQRPGALYLAVVGAQSSAFESAEYAWAFFNR